MKCVIEVLFREGNKEALRQSDFQFPITLGFRLGHIEADVEVEVRRSIADRRNGWEWYELIVPLVPIVAGLKVPAIVFAGPDETVVLHINIAGKKPGDVLVKIPVFSTVGGTPH